MLPKKYETQVESTDMMWPRWVHAEGLKSRVVNTPEEAQAFYDSAPKKSVPQETEVPTKRKYTKKQVT